MKEFDVETDILKKIDIDPNIQYASREAGIEAHADDYSFNIESDLFQQLTPLQQKLWRDEIRRAVISGGYCGLNLAKDRRYDDTSEVKEVDSEKELPKVWDRDTLDEYAYQVAYDLSNDWMRETPTWDDVETACKLGAEWKKEQLLKKSNGMYPCRDEEGDLVGYSIYYEAEGAYGKLKNVVVID